VCACAKNSMLYVCDFLYMVGVIIVSLLAMHCTASADHSSWLCTKKYLCIRELFVTYILSFVFCWFLVLFLGFMRHNFRSS